MSESSKIAELEAKKIRLAQGILFSVAQRICDFRPGRASALYDPNVKIVSGGVVGNIKTTLEEYPHPLQIMLPDSLLVKPMSNEDFEYNIVQVRNYLVYHYEHPEVKQHETVNFYHAPIPLQALGST